ASEGQSRLSRGLSHPPRRWRTSSQLLFDLIGSWAAADVDPSLSTSRPTAPRRGSGGSRGMSDPRAIGGRVGGLIVRKIEGRIIDHPVRQDGAIFSSLGRHEASRYLTVTIAGDNGTRGFGEAATAPVWSGETAETALWMLDHCLGPRLTGCVFAEPA